MEGHEWSSAPVPVGILGSAVPTPWGRGGRVGAEETASVRTFLSNSDCQCCLTAVLSLKECGKHVVCPASSPTDGIGSVLAMST